MSKTKQKGSCTIWQTFWPVFLLLGPNEILIGRPKNNGIGPVKKQFLKLAKEFYIRGCQGESDYSGRFSTTRDTKPSRFYCSVLTLFNRLYIDIAAVRMKRPLSSLEFLLCVITSLLFICCISLIVVSWISLKPEGKQYSFSYLISW